MSSHDKLLSDILTARCDSDIRFVELCNLLKKLGFEERVRGDHHIFTRHNVPDIINLQPRGTKAKPYQVKQVRNLIIAYGLVLEVPHGA